MPILERDLNHERDGTVSLSRSRSVITGGVFSSLFFEISLSDIVNNFDKGPLLKFPYDL
jgi:hypothetical protein